MVRDALERKTRPDTRQNQMSFCGQGMCSENGAANAEDQSKQTHELTNLINQPANGPKQCGTKVAPTRQKVKLIKYMMYIHAL